MENRTTSTPSSVRVSMRQAGNVAATSVNTPI